MASDGPRYGSSGVSTSVAPESNDAWVSPGNAAQGASEPSDTAASVTAATYDSGDITTRLRISSLGFSIPAGATIDGVVVEVRRYCAAGSAVDYRVQLQDDTGTLIGNNKADTGTSWPGSYGSATYGGAADMWGAALTQAMVNDPDFGVVISASATGNNTDVYVAWARVTVYYTAGGDNRSGAAGNLASTATLTAAGKKAGKGPAGTLASTATQAMVGKAAKGGAAGNLALTPGLSMVGLKHGLAGGGGGAQTPAFRDKASVASLATEGITTIELPAGVVDGDLMLLVVYLTATSGSITAPGGWTPIYQNSVPASSTSSHASLFYRVANNEPAGYDITHTNGRCTASITALSGVDGTSPIQDSDVAVDSAAGLTVPAPSVDPTGDTLLVTFHGGRILGNGAVASWTPDSAETERVDQPSGVPAISNSAHEVATQDVGAGSTGTRTATAGGTGVTSVDWIAYSVVVNPAGGGGGGPSISLSASLTATGGKIDNRTGTASATFTPTLTAAGKAAKRGAAGDLASTVTVSGGAGRKGGRGAPTYTPPVTLAAAGKSARSGAGGNVAGAPNLSALGRKGGKGAPTATFSPSLALGSRKEGKGAGGVITVSVSAMAATGGKGVDNRTGTAAATFSATLTGAGRKEGRGAGGAIGLTATQAIAGRKAGKGAAPNLNPTITMSAVGTKSEVHTGTASATFTVNLAAAGRKAGRGTPSATFPADLSAIVGRKGGKGAGGAIGLTATMAATGTQAYILALSASLAATGRKATGGAAGSLPLTPNLAAQGRKRALGAPTLPATASLVAQGVSGHRGTGNLSVAPVMAAAGSTGRRGLAGDLLVGYSMGAVGVANRRTLVGNELGGVAQQGTGGVVRQQDTRARITEG